MARHMCAMACGGGASASFASRPAGVVALSWGLFLEMATHAGVGCFCGRSQGREG